MKVYVAEICGDCRDFMALAKERGLSVEYVNITESTANLREFLKLRDHEPAFDAARAGGMIGIPAFVNEKGNVTLDVDTALGWLEK